MTDFDTVRLEAPIDVAITTGKGASATGTGDRDTLDALVLEMNSRALVIRLRSSTGIGSSMNRPRLPTRLVLTTAALKRANVLGAGSLTADVIKDARISAGLSGSGRLSIARVEADRADITQFGSGSLAVAGTVLDLMASVSGSGRLEAQALDARRTRVNSEGSADIQISASEEASVTASGSGRIVIAGKPACTVRKLGSATVNCGGADY